MHEQNLTSDQAGPCVRWSSKHIGKITVKNYNYKHQDSEHLLLVICHTLKTFLISRISYMPNQKILLPTHQIYWAKPFCLHHLLISFCCGIWNYLILIETRGTREMGEKPCLRNESLLITTRIYSCRKPTFFFQSVCFVDGNCLTNDK